MYFGSTTVSKSLEIRSDISDLQKQQNRSDPRNPIGLSDPKLIRFQGLIITKSKLYEISPKCSPYLTFAKEAIEQLQYLRSNNHLTDCVIEFEDLEFHCHFSIVILFSKYLEKLDHHDHVEINSSGMVEDPSIFEAIMLSMYGSPLDINETNLFDIHVIAKLLKYTPLISHCTNLQLKGLQSSNKVFFLQGSTILEKLKRETPHEVQLKYKDYIAKTNRLHLCCYSKYFANLWTSQWADSNEQELSFDDILKVSVESFQKFLGS
ncbi:hypothetical protein GEMRC1_013082 [Eukaryota sp. GEM-RC1]